MFHGCIKDNESDCVLKVNFRIMVVWPESEKILDGVRILIYPMETNHYVVDNLPSGGDVIRIAPRQYSFLFHNNDNGLILYRNMENYNSYEAFTKVPVIPAYARPVTYEQIVAQPNYLWAVKVDTYNINEGGELVVYPVQVIKKYTFNLLNIKGLENIRAARRSLSGMAGSYFLNSDILPSQASSFFFDAISVINNGISFDILSFGVLESVGGIDRKHILTLEFLNKSEVRRYNIDVTKLLNAIKNRANMLYNYSIKRVPKKF